MAPTPQPDKDDAHQQLLDQMDTYYLKKPFRNPEWKLGRRNKNIKQMVSETQRREASVMATQNNSGASTPRHLDSDGTVTPVPNMTQATQNLSTLVLERNLQKAASANGSMHIGATMGPAVTYMNIESAPSLQNKKQYCDVTGLPARYTDPKTKLRYYNSEIFGVIRTFPPGVPDQYLAARGANRIKGAIDDRIKEEQARQAKAQQQTNRPPPRRRPPPSDGSTARLSSRQREPGSALPGKSPDPSEFTIGEDESVTLSRVATPQPQPQPQPEATNGSQENNEVKQDDSEEQPSTEPEASAKPKEKDKDSDSEARPLIPELPVEVKAKLRKLDKLENKYAELFKAYKAAHARVQSIEAFEATLRESTPLTSIADPSALSEYLNQINLKGSMVLDELKRVSGERDAYKQKSDSLEAENKKLEETAQELKKQIDTLPPVTRPAQPIPGEPSDTANEPSLSTKETSSPIVSPKSVSSRIPSLSIFSPKNKPKEEPPKAESEDLFSFDSEIPKLEAELREKQTQIDDLSHQLTSLNGDLKVARDSTESMVHTLENTTEELNRLRDTKEKFEESERTLRERVQELEAEQQQSSERDANDVKELNKELDETRTKVQEAQVQITALAQKEKDARAELEKVQSEADGLRNDLLEERRTVEMLNQRVQQKDSINKDLEDSLAVAKKTEREQEQTSSELKANERRIQVMQGVMDRLKTQVEGADATIASLRSEISKLQQEAKEKPDAGLEDSPATQTTQEATATNSKKKNKKKKKTKGPSANTDIEPSEPLEQNEIAEDGEIVDESKARIIQLTQQIEELRFSLDEKTATIERLSKKIKDQEALQEEIETLRDDLLHQGEEHVEARDALKTARSEQQKLEELVDSLRKDLSDAQTQSKIHIETTEAHQKTIADLEELKSKHNTTLKELEEKLVAHTLAERARDEIEGKVSVLQTDLSAAEQLASSRFKDITDLKSLLEKAQPEIRELKKEVTELRSAKDELKNKTGELSRLEHKHEEVKTEIKNVGKRLSSQDAEIKELKVQIEKGTQAKQVLENELEAKESELRSAEARRSGAVELQEQTTKDLNQAKQDNESLRSKVRDLNEQLSSYERHINSLKEEISLKVALHTSSQTLVQSLRDQMHELNTTTRELTSRAESKDEELAEAQRMLAERTRESQTMRTLLNQAESGTEARLRDMKERMDAAIEERDRFEDEHSVSSRRMTRELNETQSRLRDQQRVLKTLESEKDELENRNREWRKLREDLEYASKSAEREVEETRNAMKGLREALDESERQVRELENQRMDLRRQIEESSDRVEKMTRANKNLTEEVKGLQAQTGIRRPSSRPSGIESGLQSSRTSIDSSTARSSAPSNGRLAMSSATSLPRSETPTGSAGGGAGQGTVDYVYLKNVLLQFLSQKDKGHQRQLIPVLGMLLHFDDKDQQRWNAAIAAR